MNMDNRATAQAEPTCDVARMLDEHAVKVQALETALIAGEQSGTPRVFDFCGTDFIPNSA